MEDVTIDISDTSPKAIGKRGELAAQTFVLGKGYDIIDVNWKCKIGEADIVCLFEDTIIFVEVKTRTNIERGLPEEAVNAKKRKKYECIAAMYLRDHDYVNMSVRFDVIGVLIVGNGKALIRHHINAFGAH